jgi:hypothetical protein
MIFVAFFVILKFLGFIKFSWTELFSYISVFWGMSMFYYSYLKQYKFGIFAGAVIFQFGMGLLSLALFELYQPAKIFIPAMLTIIGTSLLLANLLGNTSKFTLILSLVFIVMGVLLMIFRGDITGELFLESTYNLLKEIWWINLILVIIIVFVAIEFKNEKRIES